MDLSIKYIQESKVLGNYSTLQTDAEGLFSSDCNNDECTQISR